MRRSQAGDFLGVDAHPDGRRVIFVGDLVARGPDTLGVLDIARRTGLLTQLTQKSADDVQPDVAHAMGRRARHGRARTPRI